MRRNRIILKLALVIASTSIVFAQTKVQYSVDINKDRKSINPEIYGTNFELGGKDFVTPHDENFSCYRFGGNRITNYNWENNTSNAGHDNNHISDYWPAEMLLVPVEKYDTPAAVISTFFEHAKNKGVPGYVTLPMLGYVARDSYGPVSTADAAPSKRWCEINWNKIAPYSLLPDTSDNVVYIDECINFLIQKYGTADKGGIKGYFLDNEADLWYMTHPLIHQVKVLCSEYKDSSISYAKVIKKLDPSAKVFGPASFGFSGYYNWQDAKDWAIEGQGYTWFLSYFLDKMKVASDEAGLRLLDVLDIHWYPEAKGDNRIVFSNSFTENDYLARMNAPRTLWDSTYKENSWINDSYGKFLPLLPTIYSSIDKSFPETELAITEYDFGGGNHISGGIAQADLLGVFGKYGVDMANIWSCDFDNTYKISAFKLYRNYDGQNSTFGHTSVFGSTSDIEKSTIYASVNEKNELHIVVTNKSKDTIQADISITGSNKIKNASAYTFSEGKPQIDHSTDIAINKNILSCQLPPLSVWHFVVK